MANRVTDLVAEVTADTRKFDRSITDAERKLDRIRRARTEVGIDVDDRKALTGITGVERALAGINDEGVSITADITDAMSGTSAVGSALAGLEDEGVSVTADVTDALSGATAVGSALDAIEDEGVAITGDPSDALGAVGVIQSALTGIEDEGVAITGDASDALGAVGVIRSELAGIEDEGVNITGDPSDAMAAAGTIRSELAGIADEGVLITGDASDALSAIGSVRTELAGLQDEAVRISGAGGGALGGIANGAGVAGGAVGGLAAEAGLLKAGIAGLAGGATVGVFGSLGKDTLELADAVNATNTVFGDARGIIDAYASDSVRAAGLSETAFRNLAAGLGLPAAETVKMISLGADLASIYGGEVNDAVSAIGGLFRGETEPIRRYRVNIDQAAIDAKAMELGLAGAGEELSDTAKQQAIYALVMEETSAVQGDWSRTMGEGVNTTRTAAAEWEDARATLGQHFAPAVEAAAKGVTSLLSEFNAGEGPIAGFVDGIKSGWNATAGFRAAVGDAMSWLAERVPPAMETVRGAIATAFDWVKANVLPVVAVIASFVVEKFGEVVEWVRRIWPQVSEAIGHVMTVVKTIIRGAIDLVTTWWRAWGDDLMSILRTAWDFISRTVKNAIDVVRGIIETVLAVINGDWAKAWDGIKGILSAVWDQIKNIVGSAIDVVKSILGGAVSTIQEVWRGAWDRIKDYLATSWDLMTRTVSGAVGAVIDFFKGLPGKIVGAIGDLGAEVYGFVLNHMKHFLGAVVVRMAEVFDFFHKLPGKIVSAIGDLGSVLLQKGKDLVGGLIRGITSAPGAVADAIGGLFSGDGPGGPILPKVGGRGPGKGKNGPPAPRSGRALDRVSAIMPFYPGLRITSTYRTPEQNRRAGGSPTSYHMDKSNPAVDIGGPVWQLDRLAGALRQSGGWREMLWRTKGHFDHVHVAHEGGVVARSWGTLPGLRADERPVIAQVGETILPAGMAGISASPSGMNVTIHQEIVVNGSANGDDVRRAGKDLVDEMADELRRLIGSGVR